MKILGALFLVLVVLGVGYVFTTSDPGATFETIGTKAGEVISSVTSVLHGGAK